MQFTPQINTLLLIFITALSASAAPIPPSSDVAFFEIRNLDYLASRAEQNPNKE
jgi:hypothetical protein